MGHVLLLPSAFECDPTELAVPWKMLGKQGHRVVVATPNGAPPSPDTMVLTGKGLGLVAPILRANDDARAAREVISLGSLHRWNSRYPKRRASA